MLNVVAVGSRLRLELVGGEMLVGRTCKKVPDWKWFRRGPSDVQGRNQKQKEESGSRARDSGCLTLGVPRKLFL